MSAAEAMEERAAGEPWERLREAIARGDRGAVGRAMEGIGAGEVLRAVLRLSEGERVALLEMLGAEEAAEVLTRLPDEEAAELVEEMSPGEAAAILEELESADRADVIGAMGEEEAEAVLSAMSPEEASEARALSRYAEDEAGGLMVTEMLVYPASSTVGEVVRDLRRNAERYADYDVQYAYVTDEGGRLAGVLRLRDLLLAREWERVEGLMIRDPVRVDEHEGLVGLEALFEEHGFLGVPVVDGGGRLLGVVRRSAVEEAVGEREGSDYLKSQGIVGGEELRSMPVLRRSRRRLSWLSVNIGLNVLAASVIAFYQETLAQVIALAVFLPIISDMSGCSGSQAVAVSMRELALGAVRPADVWRVLVKEAAVGVINGVALGVLIGVVAWAWKGNGYLGLVVGGALGVNTVVAVLLGGSLPLVLKGRGIDPALASGPILTTVTDMCGFFLALSFASALLGRLA